MQKIARSSYARSTITSDDDDFMNADSVPDEEKLRELKRRIDKRADTPAPSGWGGKWALRGGIAGGLTGGVLGAMTGSLGRKPGLGAALGGGAGIGIGGAMGGLLGYAGGTGAQNARIGDIEEAKQIRDAGDYQTLLMYSKLRKERLERERAEQAIEDERQFKRDQLSTGIMGGLAGVGLLANGIRHAGMPRAGEQPSAR